MRGLEAIPTLSELAVAYGQLQKPGECIDEATLARWSQWARFDPRLAEQLAAWIVLRWRALDPLPLREALAAEPWPCAFAVLCEHGAALLAPTERKLFKAWLGFITSGLARGQGELFFIGTMRFAGPRMAAEAQAATKPYLYWGYLGRDVLINKATSRNSSTQMSPQRRRLVLRSLLDRQRRITVQDYIDALGGAVSRRVAQKDLASAHGIRPLGKTRGRSYGRVK